jgi:hypothetical protein
MFHLYTKWVKKGGEMLLEKVYLVNRPFHGFIDVLIWRLFHKVLPEIIAKEKIFITLNPLKNKLDLQNLNWQLWNTANLGLRILKFQ